MLRLRGGVETIKADPWLRRQVILSVLLKPLFWYAWQTGQETNETGPIIKLLAAPK
jgi:hypothetical protein